MQNHIFKSRLWKKKCNKFVIVKLVRILPLLWLLFLREVRGTCVFQEFWNHWRVVYIQWVIWINCVMMLSFLNSLLIVRSFLPKKFNQPGGTWEDEKWHCTVPQNPLQFAKNKIYPHYNKPSFSKATRVAWPPQSGLWKILAEKKNLFQ